MYLKGTSSQTEPSYPPLIFFPTSKRCSFNFPLWKVSLNVLHLHLNWFFKCWLPCAGGNREENERGVCLPLVTVKGSKIVPHLILIILAVCKCMFLDLDAWICTPLEYQNMNITICKWKENCLFSQMDQVSLFSNKYTESGLSLGCTKCQHLLELLLDIFHRRGFN